MNVFTEHVACTMLSEDVFPQLECADIIHTSVKRAGCHDTRAAPGFAASTHC